MLDKEPPSEIPVNRDEFKNPLKDKEGVKEIARFFRRHRLVRKITNNAFRMAFYMHVFLNPTGREFFNNPGSREFLFHREARVGMLEGAIFNHELYFPNTDLTSLDYKSALAGRYVGYDFYRKDEFGPKAEPFRNGRLLAFMLDEVKGRGPDDYTPTGLLNFFDINHLLHLDAPTIENLLKKGFIRETTYKAAFERIGIYERYRTYLGLVTATDNPLYIVTPKGNGLVELCKDGGSKVEKRQEVGVWKPAWNLNFKG